MFRCCMTTIGILMVLPILLKLLLVLVLAIIMAIDPGGF